MNHDDQFLKNLILKDDAPQLPSSFAQQTVQRIHLTLPQPHHTNNNSLTLISGMHARKRWLIGALVLIGAFALQQQHQTLLDEELLKIDTLSMSSFSVL